MPRDFGQNTLRVSPKLRMVCNGNTSVNVARSEHTAALAVRRKSDSLKIAAQEIRGDEAELVSKHQLGRQRTRGKLRKFSDAIEVNVFLTLNDDRPLAVSGRIGNTTVRNWKQHGRFATATVRLDQIHSLVEPGTGVAYVGMGETVRQPEVVLGETGNTLRSRSRGVPSGTRRGGPHNILIGIIDVGGFDFAHEDFLDDNGWSRFVRIWDQGGDADFSPEEFAYGREFDWDELNNAIDLASQIGVSPHDIASQTQQTRHSHGTHVASIAAGNHGVAPNCDIAGVLISLPDSALDRRLSFYDSTRIAHAIDYLVSLVDDPQSIYDGISINISLGTNGHAHDGSAPVCRWIDSTLVRPGRSICVSAGNSGQEAPAFEGDSGFVMGRIHTAKHIVATDLSVNLQWVVVGNGLADISENELEIWYNPQDRIAVQIKPPGEDWLEVVEPGQYLENQQLPDKSFFSIYNEIYHEANGANTIAIYLSPFLSPDQIIGVSAGVWMVRLIGRDIRNGRFDGWIERDDPRPVGKQGSRELWRFPSFFGAQSNVDNSSINSLACTNSVLAVANLDEGREIMNITSSQGPTRDKREKPEICCPGTDIPAASGFDGGTGFIEMTGTSMASPYAAGVVALMLSHNPSLTAAQIRGIVQRTARPLSDSAFTWQDDVGFGRIDPVKCVEESRMVDVRKDLRP